MLFRVKRTVYRSILVDGTDCIPHAHNAIAVDNRLYCIVFRAVLNLQRSTLVVAMIQSRG
jgi:hypothetical protein